MENSAVRLNTLYRRVRKKGRDRLLEVKVKRKKAVRREVDRVQLGAHKRNHV
jgi:hypothetical protein